MAPCGGVIGTAIEAPVLVLFSRGLPIFGYAVSDT